MVEPNSPVDRCPSFAVAFVVCLPGSASAGVDFHHSAPAMTSVEVTLCLS